MSDLVSRLSETLDELERSAKACTPGPWRWGNWEATFGTTEPDRRTLEHAPQRGPFPAVVERSHVSHLVLPSLEDSLEVGGYGDEPLEENAAHIARWDPKAVLELVGAVREIIAEFQRLNVPHVEVLTNSERGARIALLNMVEVLAKGFGISEEDDDGPADRQPRWASLLTELRGISEED